MSLDASEVEWFNHFLQFTVQSMSQLSVKLNELEQEIRLAHGRATSIENVTPAHFEQIDKLIAWAKLIGVVTPTPTATTPIHTVPVATAATSTPTPTATAPVVVAPVAPVAPAVPVATLAPIVTTAPVVTPTVAPSLGPSLGPTV